MIGGGEARAWLTGAILLYCVWHRGVLVGRCLDRSPIMMVIHDQA